MDSEEAEFVTLYRAGLIPLYACLVGLAWIFHDYFITLEDEIRYIWTQKRSKNKALFLWIRYYSLALLVFDVTQIHVFSRHGVPSEHLCVVIDPVTRLAGAIALWSIEIIMQLRVYALYRCSKTIAWVNGGLFLCSIAGFTWVLIHNTEQHFALIANVVELPLPGCPSIHGGLEWLQWVPATAFEGLLFGFALFKTLRSSTSRALLGLRVSLFELVVRDNLLYFFSIGILLICNNLMVLGVTHIPWFSYSPFHAAMGILTTRMLLNVHKALVLGVDTSLVINRGVL